MLDATGSNIFAFGPTASRLSSF